LAEDKYALLCFLKNEHVAVACSEHRISGLVSVFNGENKAVSNTGKQIVIGDIGIDEFEFWTPERRPEGHNIAMKITPSIDSFSASNVINGYTRPHLQSNAWVADISTDTAELILEWSTVQKISEIILHFDGDFDHAMESSLYGHPEDKVPFCVSQYSIFNESGELIKEVTGNYQAVNHLLLDTPVDTQKLIFKFNRATKYVPIALFELIIK